MILLELAYLLKLLGRESLDPLGDLLHTQPFVVGGLKRSQHSGPQLRLAGNFLRLPKDLIGLLGCLLGYPKTLAGGLLGGSKPLPCYLLGGLKPLLGGPLEGPHALLGVGEGAEEVPVGPGPTLAERPKALLLPAHGPREGLRGAHVLLGLLAHDLDGLTHPTLHELGVALLELKEPHAIGEEFLGSPGVLLLEPHELEPSFSDPDAAALSCREVLGYGLKGVALGLCHLSGGAGRLVDVSGGSHLVTSMADSKSLLLCSYHTYIRCKPRGVSPFVFALIHRSAWKGNSQKVGCSKKFSEASTNGRRALLGVAYPPARRLTSSTIVAGDATLWSTASAPAFRTSSRRPGLMLTLSTKTEMSAFARCSSPIRSLPSPSGRFRSRTATSKGMSSI